MKKLSQYLNEARWTSSHGSFQQWHVDEMLKQTDAYKEAELKKILDEWDEEWGGSCEWEIDGKKITLSNPDVNHTWEYDGKKWSEI